MILNRPWLALLFAGCSCALPAASAQESGSLFGGFGGFGSSPSGTPSAPAASGGTSSPGSTGSTSGGSTSGPTSGGSTSGGSSTSPSGGTTEAKPGAASSFGSPASSDAGLGATGGGTSVTGSESSLQGAGFATPKAPPSEAPSFTLPGFYGGASTLFTGGQGRLSRPRFQYTSSVAMGFDSNVFQTPADSQAIPAVTAEVLVDPGTPDTVTFVPHYITVLRRIGQGGLLQPVRVQDRVDRVITPGTPPKIDTVTLAPAQPAQEVVSSPVTQVSGGVNVQFFSPRTLFTFDLKGNADRYWNRPGQKPTDYNGSLVLGYLHRITPRLQFTSQINAAYLSQPDLSRINTPQQLGSGNYLNANLKMDLTYRWTPRITSVASLSENALLYQEKTQQIGNYYETVFGTELRYLWSPRFTVLGEARYGSITYSDASERDAGTAYLLLGGEARFNQLLSGSVRVGVSRRTFASDDQSASSPYMEATLAFRLTSQAVLNLNSRYGFEEPGAAGQERQVFRIGASYSQAFSPRLSGILGANYLHQTVTSAEGLPGSDTSDNSMDFTARTEYRVTKKFSINFNATFTNVSTQLGLSDYHRTRFFLGGEYTF